MRACEPRCAQSCGSWFPARIVVASRRVVTAKTRRRRRRLRRRRGAKKSEREGGQATADWRVFVPVIWARRRDPTLFTLSNVTRKKLCPTAVSAQSFSMLASPIRDHTRPYATHPNTRPCTRANTTQGILYYIRPAHPAYITRLDTLLINTIRNPKPFPRLLPLYPGLRRSCEHSRSDAQWNMVSYTSSQPFAPTGD